MRGRPVIDDYLDELPPWRVRALARVERQAHGVGVGLTRKSLTKIFSLLVAEGVAVVEVDRAAALRAGIDAEFERSTGSFLCALNQRLKWQDAPAANVDGHGVERGMDAGRPGNSRSGVEGNHGCRHRRGLRGGGGLG